VEITNQNFTPLIPFCVNHPNLSKINFEFETCRQDEPERKNSMGSSRHRWEDNIKIDIKQ
jgi:hypothetical protein